MLLSSAAKPVASWSIPGDTLPLSSPGQPSSSAQRLCAYCLNGELDAVRVVGSPALSAFIWSLRGNTSSSVKGAAKQPTRTGGGRRPGPGP